MIENDRVKIRDCFRQIKDEKDEKDALILGNYLIVKR